MLLYIAGRMTGLPQYNFGEFMLAKAKWEAKGYQVETPFDGSNRVWQKNHGRDYVLDVDFCEYGSRAMMDCWLADTEILCRCEGVVLLRDWVLSRGARIEAQTAILLGKKLYDNRTMEEVKYKIHIAFSPL